jgi:hypothetical protein
LTKNNKDVIIPNKKGVEILVKKIFKILFPFDEKITDSEIMSSCTRG